MMLLTQVGSFAVAKPSSVVMVSVLWLCPVSIIRLKKGRNQTRAQSAVVPVVPRPSCRTHCSEPVRIFPSVSCPFLAATCC